MFSSHHLLNAFAFIGLSATMLWQQSIAMLPDNNAINNLYDNLLQREYAGPVIFPNHRMERKAQRSPSLRLRFGRRSDPNMYLPSADKRWFGDVNQKPIRSPSLRLRFGRRSDPSMPMHGEFDALMNSLTAANVGGGIGVGGVNVNGGGITDVDDSTAYFGDEYTEDLYDNAFERVVRKPQRLRFGRSLSKMPGNEEDELEHARQQQTDEILNSLLNSEKLHNMLLSLRQYDSEPFSVDGMGLNNNDDEFEREVRKPAPLRLRFGRSTGGVTEALKTVTKQNSTNVNKNTTNGAEQQQEQQSQAKN